MKTGPVRIALFGLGQWGNCHRAILEDCARDGLAELACAFTWPPAHAEARSSALGIPVYHRENWRMIFDVHADLDAVQVATPDPFHAEFVLAALQRGLHVYVEKPMATTVAECIEIARLARERGRLIEIGFHKRFDPAYKHAEVRLQAERVYDPPEDREIEGKPLGHVLKGKATMEEPQLVPREWFRMWADRSSPAFYLGTHMYDIVRFLIRSEPRGVIAYGHRGLIRSRTRGAPTPDGVDTWDTVQAQVFFRNGASFYFDTSWVLPDRGEYLTRQYVDIVGEDGVIDIDTCRRGFRSTTERLGPREDNPHFFKANLRDGRLVYEGYGVENIRDFLRRVRRLRAGESLDAMAGHYPSEADGLVATAIAEATERSLEGAAADRRIETPAGETVVGKLILLPEFRRLFHENRVRLREGDFFES